MLNSQAYYVQLFTRILLLFLYLNRRNDNKIPTAKTTLSTWKKKMKIVHVLVMCIIILLNIPVVKCEVFTSIEHIKALLKTHDNVFENLKQYIEKEEQRLNILKRSKVYKYFSAYWPTYYLLRNLGFFFQSGSKFSYL